MVSSRELPNQEGDLFAGQKKRAEGALAAAEQNEAYQDFRGAAILFEEGGKLDNAFANYIASSEQQKEVATRRLFSAESNKKKGAGYVTACLRDAAKAYDIAAHSSQEPSQPHRRDWIIL